MKKESKEYRIGSWLTFYLKITNFSLRITIGNYDDNRVEIIFSPILFSAFVRLPIKTKHGGCETPQYGIYWFENNIVLCWGNWLKHIGMPWILKWYSTSMMLKNGLWLTQKKGSKINIYSKEIQGTLWEESYPYAYELKSGAVQERIATIKRVDREWRRFMFTKLFGFVRTDIEIEFSDEVGEKSGSWKGGTIGCSYTIKPGETPEQCLRRMEKERKF